MGPLQICQHIYIYNIFINVWFETWILNDVKMWDQIPYQIIWNQFDFGDKNFEIFGSISVCFEIFGIFFSTPILEGLLLKKANNVR